MEKHELGPFLPPPGTHPGPGVVQKWLFFGSISGPYGGLVPGWGSDLESDHGNDIRHRIELETPLSSLSGVQWSRDNIFLAPLGHNPVTRQGQPITQVNLFDQQQTGMPPVTLDELSSVTLGSYQPKLVRTYLTSLR